MTGLEAGETILSEFPDAKLLFLTTFNDDEYIVKALSIGAKGYIIKQDFDSIVPSLKAVNSGQSVFGNEITEKLPNILIPGHNDESVDKTSSFDYEAFGLTNQEYEIIRSIADGLSNKEIADKLFLSEGTVRNYISSILSETLNKIHMKYSLWIFIFNNIAD